MTAPFGSVGLHIELVPKGWLLVWIVLSLYLTFLLHTRIVVSSVAHGIASLM